MAKLKEVLNPDEYSNYRNIRAVSWLFVVFGSILALGGLGLLFGDPPNPREAVHPAVAAGMALAGLAGAVGGIAALRGNRRLAPLVYIMAALYVFGFPIGTILSVVMFKGLSRYLDSSDKVKAAIT